MREKLWQNKTELQDATLQAFGQIHEDSDSAAGIQQMVELLRNLI